MDLNTNNLSLNITDYKSDHKTPYLYEVWNWEGDQSVLPYKWADIISKALGETKYSIEYLKKNYISKPDFMKDRFFFITSRSKVAGSLYINHINDMYIVEFLCIDPSQIDKGIAEALISLSVKLIRKINETNISSGKEIIDYLFLDKSLYFLVNKGQI